MKVYTDWTKTKDDIDDVMREELNELMKEVATEKLEANGEDPNRFEFGVSEEPMGEYTKFVWTMTEKS